MYASGQPAMEGDTVKGSKGVGTVQTVTPNGVGGVETATVEWTTPHEKTGGINAPLAPSTVPTSLLTLVKRNTEQ